MQKLLLILTLILMSISVSSQSDVDFVEVTKQSILKAKEMSIYSNEVNWDSLSTVIVEEAKQAKSYTDLEKPLSILLNGLRDHHGTFYYNNQRVANFTDYKNTRKTDVREFDTEIWEEVNYNSQHEYKLLENKIAYVKIVGIGRVNILEESQTIRDKMDSLANLGAEKWIIDLRYNGGGNWHPMLEALAPLLGNGQIGGDADINGQLIETSLWEIKDNDFVYRDFIAAKIPKSNNIKSNSKVAILISRYTVSSGEAVVTSFKGRKNTVFIGETTGGYTTVNCYEAINSDLTMSISVTYYADRNGIVYKENLEPDIQIEFQIEKDNNKDQGIMSAIEWLK